MKKIIYMLPLAICLILAGCAKWDEFEPLPADTWGAVSELTVETPDTVTTTELPITVITRNANYVALLVSDTAMVNIDYTTLMQGQYAGASRFETNYEADTLNLTMSNVVAGSTYHLYVVATNKAGVQTTFNKAIGAVDVTAPVITSTFPLTPTNEGRTVTLAFSETIVRESGAGAITYQVLDGTMTEVFKGTVAETDIEASGRNLRVSLPATVEFAEGVQYAILLSFAQGAVADVYGNPMAAINNQLEDGGLPSGPWWRYVNEGGGGDTPGGVYGFLSEGTYVWTFDWEDSQGSYSGMSTATQFTCAGETSFDGIDAYKWNISNFLVDLGFFDASSSMTFNGFSLEYSGANFFIIMDESLQDYAQVGTAEFTDGTTRPIWLAYLDGNQVGADVTLEYENGTLQPSSLTPNLVLITESDQAGYVSLVAYIKNAVVTYAGEDAMVSPAKIREQIKAFNPATAQKFARKKEMRSFY